MLVRNLREGPKWVRGTIAEQTGPVSYRVQVSDQIWRRHTDQILDCSETRSTETETPVPDMVCSQVPSSVDTEHVPPPLNGSVPLSNTEHLPPLFTEQPNTTATTVLSEPKQYPRRERKPPDRLSHQKH